MKKRRIAVCVSDTSYVVIEMKDKKGCVYVEFIPTVWLKPNAELAPRTAAKCYFPRRLHCETKGQHLKFVKNAKFICMTPENNDKWELKDCRVLKIAIDCIDDAINAEKMFSDYFDTTETELEVQRSPPLKRVRKTIESATKKVHPVNARDSDDSEGDAVVSGCNKQISDYNAAFKSEIEFNGMEETNMVENQQPANGCNCMNEMCKKMEYFQKRVMNEIADFRREAMSAIRKLTDIVSGSSNIILNKEAYESAQFSGKYEGSFPVNDKDTLFAMNKRMKSEIDLKMFVELKLDKIKGKDATKTVRKMLNALCTVNCMDKFTWLGTNTKGRFCDLDTFIDIMAKIIERRFPKCDAFNIIESLVKQRLKTAGDAMK